MDLPPVMSQRSDLELLGRFVDGRDEHALEELVRRYFGLVHSAARRQTRGDSHLASDITQAVFIVLVRKASSLHRRGSDTILPAWLHAVTRNAAGNAIRMEARRAAREARHARTMREDSIPAADAPVELADEIRSVLDDGIAQLSSLDRSSVLMHYFGGQTHRQIGEALGLSEDAARKRLARAMDKLRSILVTRSDGAGSVPRSHKALRSAAAPALSVAIAGVLAEESASAATLAAQGTVVTSTANVAMLTNQLAFTGASATAAASPVLIARAVLRTARAARIRISLGAAAVVILLLCIAPMVAHVRNASNVAAPPADAPISTLNGPLVATLDDGTIVRFLGVSTYPPERNSWFAADGSLIALPDDRLLGLSFPTATPPNYEAAVRIESVKSDLTRLNVANAVSGANIPFRDGNNVLLACLFTISADTRTADLNLTIANDHWTTLATSDASSDRVSFDPIAPDNDGAGSRITARHNAIPGAQQLIVIDTAGAEHQPTHVLVTTLNQVETTCSFDVPPARIAKVALQTKGTMRTIRFKNVSLAPGERTQPSVSVDR